MLLFVPERHCIGCWVSYSDLNSTLELRSSRCTGTIQHLPCFPSEWKKEREMANVKNLRTGFTGELNDTSGVTAKAKKVAANISDEASAVAQSAQDHPTATSTALLIFGAAAFVAGYLIGSASESTRRSYW